MAVSTDVGPVSKAGSWRWTIAFSIPATTSACGTSSSQYGRPPVRRTQCTAPAVKDRHAIARTRLARMSPGIQGKTISTHDWPEFQTNTIPSRGPDEPRQSPRQGFPTPSGHTRVDRRRGGSAYGVESGAIRLAFSMIRSSVDWSASISPVWASTSISPTSPRRPRPGRARNRGTRHRTRSPVTINEGSSAATPVPTLESTKPPTFCRATKGVMLSVADTWT